MQPLVLLVAAAALLSVCHSLNLNKHNMRLIQDMDNSIQPNSITKEAKRRVYERKFARLIKRPAPAYLLQPGSSLELTCEAMGAPAPTIHWYRNDEHIYDHNLASNEITGINPTSIARLVSTLVVTRTEGQDRYTCQVRAGEKSVRASTMVYSADGSTEPSERTKLAPLAPLIVGTYEAYMDVIGSDVRIACRAIGHPKPHIKWINNKGVDVTKVPRMTVLRSGELLISGLTWADMGEYKCEATNFFGSHTATTFVYPAKAD